MVLIWHFCEGVSLHTLLRMEMVVAVSAIFRNAIKRETNKNETFYMFLDRKISFFLSYDTRSYFLLYFNILGSLLT